MDPKDTEQIEPRLGDIAVPVKAVISQTAMSPREMLGLRVGDIIPAGKIVGEPMELRIEGRRMAQGEVVLVNGRMAIRLVRAIPLGEDQASGGTIGS